MIAVVLTGDPWLWPAHLSIISPFSSTRLVQLFSTHPTPKERVKWLEPMAREGIAVSF
jgi:Zn-dependent protease with chaperone function